MSVRTAYSARPTGRAYRFGSQRPTDEKKYWGNHFANEQVVRLRKLCWTRPDGRSATTIRILPGIDSETPGEWGPTRLSPDPFDFGDWIRCYKMCRLGERAATLITHDPIADPDYDVSRNPGTLLWAGVKHAIKNECERPGWGALLQGGEGRAAVLAPPRWVHLVRCVVVEWGPEEIKMPQGLDPMDKIVVMDLGKGAGEKTTWLVDERVQGTEDEPEPQFVLPDPLDISAGLFFRYFPLTQDPRKVRATTPQSRSFSARAQSAPATGKGEREEFGFGVYTLDALEDGTPPSLAEFSEALLKKTPSWDEILVFHSEEEQARILAPKFDRALLDYCWREFPEFLAIAREASQKSVNVPADVEDEEEAPPAAQTRPARTFGQQAAAATPAHPGAVPSALPTPRPWTPPGLPGEPPIEPAAVTSTAAPTAAVMPSAPDVAAQRSKLEEAKARFAQRSTRPA